jgi:GNAT superfamily N-acetyltransferase
MDVTLREATPEDLLWAQQRWAEVRFVPGGPADRVVVALLQGERAGVGRIVPVGPGAGELGGMYVLPAFRGQGIAPHIVRYLLDSEQGTLFCIPFVHLRELYVRCGFREAPEGTPLPDPILHKLHFCAETYPDPVVLLIRPGGGR